MFFIIIIILLLVIIALLISRGSSAEKLNYKTQDEPTMIIKILSIFIVVTVILIFKYTSFFGWMTTNVLKLFSEEKLELEYSQLYEDANLTKHGISIWIDQHLKLERKGGQVVIRLEEKMKIKGDESVFSKLPRTSSITLYRNVVGFIEHQHYKTEVELREKVKQWDLEINYGDTEEIDRWKRNKKSALKDLNQHIEKSEGGEVFEIEYYGNDSSGYYIYKSIPLPKWKSQFFLGYVRFKPNLSWKFKE